MHPILKMRLIEEWNDLHLNSKIPFSSWKCFTCGINGSKQNIQKIGYNEYAEVCFLIPVGILIWLVIPLLSI